MADESDGAAMNNLGEDPEEEEEEEDGFTFAAATGLPVGGAFGDGHAIGRVYPVFGRPRSPPLQLDEEEDAGSATVRVPLRQLLLAERGSSSSPSGHQPDDEDGDDGELDGVPAETYCLWSPGTSPSPSSNSSSPSQCPKSGSTGSVLRWRQRLQVGRSHSDGKEKFVFLQQQDTPVPPRSSSPSPGSTRTGRTGESPRGAGVRGWSYYGRGRGRGRSSSPTTTTFLPYKQDLVGFFANAGALRRSYHPF
uniref:Uncharacterized protein n=1 Tax=Avena sativa TaxID=4498 RepID=A0ACD5TZI2_AVESA